VAIDPDARANAIAARTEATAARRDALDLHGQLGGVAAELAATRREVRSVKVWNAGMIAIAVAAIGAITQVQVARINAIRPEQDSVAAERARQRDLDAIGNRFASRLDQMQTEIERVRRNAPAEPLARETEKVTKQ
jgi:hypothetical protein